MKVRLHRSCWPVLRRIAWLYRRTLLRKTGIIAVVGSFGKTTTTRAVASALGPECSSRAIGNVQSFIADGLLRVSPAARWAVLEVGVDRPGQMEILARMLSPDVVIVTGIGSEHNRSFLSLDVTRYEKSRILSVLDENDTAILNGDDLNVRWMSGRTKARVVTYGFGPQSDVCCTEFQCVGPEEASLEIASRSGRHRIRVRLPSRQQALSLLASFAAGENAAKLPAESVLERLAGFEAVQGRFQPVRLPSGAVLIRDEFKSAPETIRAAVDALAEIPARRRIVVLGEVSEPPGSMGPIYREIGRRVANVADVAVFVSRNFQRYSAGGRKVGNDSAFVDVGPDFEKAVDFLHTELRNGDLVLLKGRDTQKLDRIALALMGRAVHCRLRMCRISMRCDQCSRLSGED